MNPWIGFDLDSTLAYHEPGESIDIIGDPIPMMLARVMEYLNKGMEVRIVTARVEQPNDPVFVQVQRMLIHNWCVKHIGRPLKIQANKDFAMIKLYDDRAVQVIPNTC
jgi:hypothetical protein